MHDLTARQLAHGRFWKKYLRLTRAGVTMLRALEIIQAEEASPDFREIIIHLHDRASDGFQLSEAMEDHADVFSLSARELIRTAERQGHWDLVIEELAGGLLEGTFDG